MNTFFVYFGVSFWSQRKSSLVCLSDICYLGTFGTGADILDAKHLIKEEKILSVWLFVTFLQFMSCEPSF